MIDMSRDGAVVLLRLNDPERRNALSMPLRLALLDTLREIEADTTVRAVVLTGSDKFFCPGGDVTAMGEQPKIEALDRMRVLHEIVRLMAYSSKPLIAAVEGWAVGGGFSLAMLCDTVVAGRSARFKAGFGEIGMAPDTGILFTLPRRVGIGPARQILLYNDVMDCEQARALGVVDHVVETGGAVEQARSLALRLAQKPPLPIALTRSVLNAGLDDILLREREIQTMLFSSSDHLEGRAAFFEKRPAVFHGN
ncbi:MULTISPECIES: enoyl-CoA hydratase/isomerase family protein [Alcaligenaceae]|uniref:Enoyl-CoA hydratase n=1 Tax=Bordetella petrii (strain ATCC BAA-461 / DSM 12804 / CCUG 43448 / CIP 107267 / Se-1111R) TaxID=340100 RepID=A9ICE0_BORPD|nr:MULTISPECIES: enoyl-CoA hydratase/isomerase family protein [Alcaligenaceae]CAP41556.1 enoyl-CoA hydratase [Bordetella petrii]CUJ31207.1 4-chlorobenzoyl coenzyme A dehalogenase-2 [Achromobacter xylosoxidans]CUJ71286.1 4-chlorobenzoyl coenzyme A dehalogenase-2 [Achromobacter xylosoxidans]